MMWMERIYRVWERFSSQFFFILLLCCCFGMLTSLIVRVQIILTLSSFVGLVAGRVNFSHSFYSTLFFLILGIKCSFTYEVGHLSSHGEWKQEWKENKNLHHGDIVQANQNPYNNQQLDPTPWFPIPSIDPTRSCPYAATEAHTTRSTLLCWKLPMCVGWLTVWKEKRKKENFVSKLWKTQRCVFTRGIIFPVSAMEKFPYRRERRRKRQKGVERKKIIFFRKTCLSVSAVELTGKRKNEENSTNTRFASCHHVSTPSALALHIIEFDEKQKPFLPHPTHRVCMP